MNNLNYCKKIVKNLLNKGKYNWKDIDYETYYNCKDIIKLLKCK